MVFKELVLSFAFLIVSLGGICYYASPVPGDGEGTQTEESLIMQTAELDEAQEEATIAKSEASALGSFTIEAQALEYDAEDEAVADAASEESADDEEQTAVLTSNVADEDEGDAKAEEKPAQENVRSEPAPVAKQPAAQTPVADQTPAQQPAEPAPATPEPVACTTAPAQTLDQGCVGDYGLVW
ncbi:MAG: hypothetical protein K6G57_05035 [Lachnospiraceae bacterium]|nr:hypothetical protein [Lachnospiraceae bacterium]